jgi:hypothetical protein
MNEGKTLDNDKWGKAEGKKGYIGTYKLNKSKRKVNLKR